MPDLLASFAKREGGENVELTLSVFIAEVVSTPRNSEYK